MDAGSVDAGSVVAGSVEAGSVVAGGATMGAPRERPELAPLAVADESHATTVAKEDEDDEEQEEEAASDCWLADAGLRAPRCEGMPLGSRAGEDTAAAVAAAGSSLP